MCSVAVAVLAACGTSPAPDFRGRWKPVNEFAEQPLPIPLRSALIFSVSPADATLKGVLVRWAGDAGYALRYDAPMDYTLHAAASDVSADNLATALSRLEAAYSLQELQIRIRGRAIEVGGGDRANVSSVDADAGSTP
jgi:hypothetical protein